VDGNDGRRLAVECDGDSFHGPEQWRDDMRRQRVLERVGWRFWRCFASSTLSRMGIEPVLNGEPDANGRYTEHRIIGATTDIERVTRSYSQNGRNHQTTEPRTNGDAHSKNIADESVPMCAGRQIVKREQLNGAFFVQFDDGSIEITTANRTLHFSSLQELLSSTSKSPSQAD
jgi:REase_MTES_1575